MTHLSMEQLLVLREPAAEPGAAAAREHLETCAVCQVEFEALHQRVARLRALPTLRPPRDRWPVVAGRLRAERAGRRRRMALTGGLALAASVALLLLVGRPPRDGEPAPGISTTTEQAITDQMRRAQALEAAIRAYNPEARPLNGRTARIAAELEDQIASLDRQLEAAELQQMEPERDVRRLQLWRERVGLLDALVDVHLTRASNAGL